MLSDKKREDLEKELLFEAFDECLEEQQSFLPSEREIARMHHYSENFREGMQRLLDNGSPSTSEKSTPASKTMILRFSKIAACILAALVLGGICTGVLLRSESNTEETTGATSETAASIETETALSEEDKSTENGNAAAEESEAPAEKISFTGRDIYLAEIQTVSGETESVKTLVSSPVIALDAAEIKITIGNISESPISYNSNMELQVQSGGAWYVVPRKTELVGQQDTTVVLEPGMAQDEEFDLTDYDLDEYADLYRVITYVDGVPFSAEFRFENIKQE